MKLSSFLPYPLQGINSGLITFFFGEDREGNLTVDKFLEFQRRLQNEILALGRIIMRTAVLLLFFGNCWTIFLSI